MGKGRLEAFSDGVIAILITIMVLELKTPHGEDWSALKPLVPTLLSYLLSFVYLGIYWNNHHHMLHTVTRVTGGILWANLMLLFWLSLLPFTTGWVGETHYAVVPSAAYGITLLMSAVSYTVLQNVIIASQGEHSLLRRATGHDWKGKFSLTCYIVAIASTFWVQTLSLVLYVVVALTWLIPDRRIERALSHSE